MRVVSEEVVTTNTVVNVTNVVVKTVPYVVIDSRKALSMGGASGGDEVRLLSGGAVGGDAVHSVKSQNGTNEIIHVFTEAGKTKTLVVPLNNSIVPGSASVLVVGGGGAGGAWCGGGAEGVVEKTGLTLPAGTSYVYVGEGGGLPVIGNNGEDSLLTIGDTTYTAIGGGAGGTYYVQRRTGFAGGSGGGGSHLAKGGKALQPKTAIGGVGFDGGDGRHLWSGGGGGGAGGRGLDSSGYRTGGKGGGSKATKAVVKSENGVESVISGIPGSYANGGVGRVEEGRYVPQDGNANTGAGGDGTWAGGISGGGAGCGKKGGCGIVVVRYAVKDDCRNAAGNPTKETNPSFDSDLKTELINGVEWRYFVENGAATIGCHGRNSLNHPDLWIAAVDTNALSGVVRIPARLGGLPVRKIGKGAFQGCNNVTRFVVPEGVTHCAARAFARCARLNAVVYPRSLSWLGEGQVYRSSGVKAIAFKGKPPKCDFARCPFKGCATGAQLVIPYVNRSMWRNVGEQDPYLCDDGCHALHCTVRFSKEEQLLARQTHAGFVRFCRPPGSWKNEADIRDLCDEVWRRADKNGANGQCLFMSDVYNNVAPSNQNVIAYATAMHLKVDEEVEYRLLIGTKAILLVDDEVVIGPTSIRRCYPWRQWVYGKHRAEDAGWHRITMLMTTADYYIGNAADELYCVGKPNNEVPSPGVSDDNNGCVVIWNVRRNDGEPGGVFYRRSGEKAWRRFEATPDGKTFRVTPADIRRAIADIDSAKKQK